MNVAQSQEISQEKNTGASECVFNHSAVLVADRDSFLWLHSIFALLYFIITMLCMAHHSIKLEYREDEKVWSTIKASLHLLFF